MQLLGSKLFLRAFAVIVAVVIVFSASIFLFTTSAIDTVVDEIEEAADRTILDNVYELVAQTVSEIEVVERTSLEEKRRNLRTAVDLAQSYIDLKMAEAKEGRMSPAQARARILDVMRKFRFGSNDYIWIADYDSRLISHPSPELHGQDASTLIDIHGNSIVAPMVEKAQAFGDGYYVYWWRRLGQTEPSEKLTYFRNLPELRMVVGAGFYLDDLKLELEQRRKAAIVRLRHQLSTIKIANTGYLYIFDGKNHFIAHPNPNLDDKNASDVLEPISKTPITTLLKNVSDSKDGLHYKWDKPDDPGNYVYEKISWVRYFPKYDWYIASSVYTDELRSGSKLIGRKIMWISLVFLFVSVTLGYLFVRSLTTPIVQLARTAKQVRDGDLRVSSDIRRNDEIGELVVSFNAMVKRLQEDIEHLDSRVMARTAELLAANERLKEVDKMKSDFMSSVSHEFKTPLTSIRGFLSIIRREFSKHFAPLAGADEKLLRKGAIIEEDLDVVERESLRLTQLINDVLDYTDLISGRTEWQDEELSAKALLDEAISRVAQNLASKPSIALTLDCPQELPSLKGDRAKLVRLLVNLLDNAIKFTDAGAIAIKVGIANENKLRISIKDSGPGIPEDQVAHIFTHFHQILEKDALIDKPKGTGLGLAICKQIVEHHDGSISVSSELGAGSEFSIVLPISF